MCQIIVLGSSAAMPARHRNPAAQVVVLPHIRFLIDCGEGTQMQMLRYRVKPSQISHIFITHLHGDHFLGLVGLLSSYHLQGRSDDLHLFAPPDLADILRATFKVSNTVLQYKIVFHPLPKAAGEVIYQDEQVSVSTLLMNHGIDCWGFVIQEKTKKRKVITQKIAPNTHWDVFVRLKEGEDIYDSEGNLLYSVADCTTLPPSYRFVHCSDTLFSPTLAAAIGEADLMYHEATFLHKEIDKATKTHHSTARQAAQMAALAGAKKLVIGHFSPRYLDLSPLIAEAQEVFPNTVLAQEGVLISANTSQARDDVADATYDEDTP